MARIFIIFTVVIFALIGFAALRKDTKEQIDIPTFTTEPIEIVLQEEEPVTPPPQVEPEPQPFLSGQESFPRSCEGLPTGDRIEELFNVGEPKLPIVTTITYKSHVSWLQGRLAWISDYASHYNTSSHFIARSLNDKPYYNKHDIAEGQKFNIIDPEKEILFHLLIDVSRSKMWFYAIDKTDNQTTLLKTYDVGLGRIDSTKKSGLLTPLGVYSLGSRTAIYKPNVTGFYNGKKVEMIQIFGTRWIPFDNEIASTTAPARGFGIHGIPWTPDPTTGKLAEQHNSIRSYDSDGCIHLLTEDMEEIFAIIVTKPTTIELVSDFNEAKYLK